MSDLPKPRGVNELPLVSVVIVAHNAASRLGPCLESLRKQDYPRARREFVFVHSDCPDGTQQAFEDWRDGPGREEKVKILANPKRILACGWNVALAACEGDVIVRLDAHLEAEAGFLRNNIAAHLERGEAITGGPCPSMTPSDTLPYLLWMAERSRFGAGQATFRGETVAGYVDTLAQAAYDRKVFAKVGGYDERLGRTEDNEIHYRMKQAGFKFYYDPSIRSRRLARAALRGMLRQKLMNGYWIAVTLPVSPKCFSLRHFVPGFFVIAIIITLALLALGWHWPWITLAVTYGACALLAALWDGLRSGSWRGYLLGTLLPVMFLGMHVAYGIGLLWGLTAIPAKLKKWRGYELPHPIPPE